MAGRSVAVIGAGFSGTLLAVQLLRRAAQTMRIILIERRPELGCGPAYAPGHEGLLLNVPAGRMSAFENKPNDFREWLVTRPVSVPTVPNFAPRAQYGAYLQQRLHEELKRHSPDRFSLVQGEALALDQSAGPLRLTLDGNRDITADIAVLAIGNFPPGAPPVADTAFYGTSRYYSDPWAPQTLDGLPPDEPVLLIGTGLTMVDVVVSLLQQGESGGHRGPIHALSRRGLLPQRHADAATTECLSSRPLPTQLSALFAEIRREARSTMQQGGTWQSVIDGLRPFTKDLWQSLSPSDQAMFLRHVRPWWDLHRHRIPTKIADQMAAACERGQLIFHAGRIQHFAAREDGVEVVWRARRTGQIETTVASRVINCTGPSCDYQKISHPLVCNLYNAGVIRADPLRLGLDVTQNCALRDANGAISRRLYAVGPVTKGAFWEMTAVPDIRKQCEALAQHLADLA